MKKSLLSILCMLCAAFAINATEATITFSTQGYSNTQEVASATIDENITATFSAGTASNAPKYYTTGSGIRVYANNTMTIAGGTDVTITKIEITASGKDYRMKATVDSGEYTVPESGTVTTWEGSANSVTFTASNTSRNQKITVTYTGGTVTPTLTVVPKGTINMAVGLGGFQETVISFETKALTEGITASIDNANFSLSATSIPLGGALTVSYTGNTAATTETATITFKSGDVTATSPVSAYTATHAGTEADPLTIADVIAMNNANSDVFYVKGYIVGAINNSALVTSGQNANVALADLATETELEKLSSVQLPSGTTRAALNIVDNPGNIGQQVVVKGTLEAYNSTKGVKNAEYVSGLTATTTDYATIAEWKTAAPAGLKQGRITGNVSVVYQNGNYLWIKDTTGSILVYGALSNEYKNGDVLAGITGTLNTTSAGVPQFIPVADSFGTATAGSAVAPEVMAIEDIATDMVNQYVQIQNVKIANTSGNNYTATDATGSAVVYNLFSSTVTVTEGENLTVTGFVTLYNSAIEIYPTEVTSASGVENINVADVNAPVEYYNLQGVKVLNPENGGLYIRRQGATVTKVLVK